MGEKATQQPPNKKPTKQKNSKQKQNFGFCSILPIVVTTNMKPPTHPHLPPPCSPTLQSTPKQQEQNK